MLSRASSNWWGSISTGHRSGGRANSTFMS
jgi:hypothetical protein